MVRTSGTAISPLSAFSLCLLFDQSCRVLANLPRSFTFMPTNLQKITIKTTQVCVNIGFLRNIYLQCDLSFHCLTFKICLLLRKINKIKYIQAKLNANVVECLSCPFICLGALLHLSQTSAVDSLLLEIPTPKQFSTSPLVITPRKLPFCEFFHKLHNPPSTRNTIISRKNLSQRGLPYFILHFQ